MNIRLLLIILLFGVGVLAFGKFFIWPYSNTATNSKDDKSTSVVNPKVETANVINRLPIDANNTLTPTQTISHATTQKNSTSQNIEEQQEPVVLDLIEAQKIELMRGQSVKIWSKGCTLVVLDKKNQQELTSGRSLVISATDNTKTLHLVEKSQLRSSKNRTHFSRNEKAGVLSEARFEQINQRKTENVSKCQSRYQMWND